MQGSEVWDRRGAFRHDPDDVRLLVGSPHLL